jgi:acetyl-CoA/propionyl-CoA carboxylase, biotin carboxylase, biotin carboxyl carrier protein
LLTAARSRCGWCVPAATPAKLLAAAPAPFLSDGQRSQLERCAAAICREAGYVNAGPVEFLLSPAGELSFLEVNTRLQVEHSATEGTIDVDLVRAQLLIAAGHQLAAATGDAGIEPRRHAIEFRVNAEDPDRGFSPATGTITRFRPPGGPGVRVDSGVEAGSVIGGQFDSLLAKVIVTGRDRTQAIERARRALAEFEITGVRTTLPFLRRCSPSPLTPPTARTASPSTPAGSSRTTCPPRRRPDRRARRTDGWRSASAAAGSGSTCLV